MVSYARLFSILEERKIPTIRLRNEWGISGETLLRLKKGQSVSTNTLDKLCEKLECMWEDIAEYIPNSADETMGHRIALVMNKRGMNGNQLAIKAGITRQSVSVYLRGISKPGNGNLEKISKALGVSTQWLKGEKY